MITGWWHFLTYQMISYRYKRAQQAPEGKTTSYMIPTFYNIMKEFPKTSNGKIDRKSLIFQLMNWEKQEVMK